MHKGICQAISLQKPGGEAEMRNREPWPERMARVVRANEDKMLKHWLRKTMRAQWRISAADGCLKGGWILWRAEKEGKRESRKVYDTAGIQKKRSWVRRVPQNSIWYGE